MPAVRTLTNLLEMIRFSHTLFALPFALLAAVALSTLVSELVAREASKSLLVKNAPAAFFRPSKAEFTSR